ncbi:MAG: hypothetical protein PHZ24_04590 [Bacteroidales bacterium]|nr:hypothetical protein [Bacteroidales bacterium]
MKKKLINYLVKFKKQFLILLGLTAAIICLFAVFYISKINIYDDFSIRIYQNGENISDKVEINGISFFNRQKPLINNSNEWQNKTWYFKALTVKFNPHLQNGELVNYIITDLEGNVYEQSSKVQNNIISIYTNHENSSWINKLKILIPFNWLNALNLYIFLICFVITLIFFFRKAIFISTEYKKFSVDIKNLRFLIFTLLLIAGTILRFNNPTDTILAYDYYGHLSPTVKFLNFGGFDHHEWAYPYPIFVISTLSLFKNINAICFIQHILSLISLTGLIIYLEYYYKHLKTNTSFQIVYTISTAFVFGILFLNGNFIFFEKMMHHEGLIIPSTVFIVILLMFYFNSFKKSHRTQAFTFAVFGLFFTSLLQYRFTVGFFTVAVLLLIIEIVHQRKINIKKTILSVIIFFILYLSLFLPEYYLINKYEKNAPSFAYTEFVFSNAKIVKKIIDEGKYVDSDFDTTVFEPAISIALENPNKNTFPTLGYNFDYLKYKLVKPALEKYIVQIYSESPNPIYKKPTLANDQNITKIYNDYFKNWTFLILKEYPQDVLLKTINQLIHATIKQNINYIRYNSSVQITNPDTTISTKVGIKFLTENYNFKEGHTYNICIPKKNNFVFNLTGLMVKIMLILSFGYTVFSIIRKRYPLLSICISIIIGCTLITIAILHSFDIARYLQTILPFILILSLVSVLEFVQQNHKKQIKLKDYNLPTPIL